MISENTSKLILKTVLKITYSIERRLGWLKVMVLNFDAVVVGSNLEQAKSFLTKYSSCINV